MRGIEKKKSMMVHLVFILYVMNEIINKFEMEDHKVYKISEALGIFRK